MARYRVKFQGCSAAFSKMQDTFFVEAEDLEQALKNGQAQSIEKLGFDGQLEKISVRQVDERSQLIGSPLEITYRTTCPEKRRKDAARRRR